MPFECCIRWGQIPIRTYVAKQQCIIYLQIEHTFLPSISTYAAMTEATVHAQVRRKFELSGKYFCLISKNLVQKKTVKCEDLSLFS